MKGSDPILCSALALPEPSGAGEVPEWLHLLPAGEVRTVDGRGPYQLTDTAAVIATSLQATGGKLPLDECHSTDRAAVLGNPAPARGWIVELQARADGLWGRVDWTPQGRAIMADKQYRGLSPAIVHDKAKRITAVLRASLINTPNLVGLTALHSTETNMDLLAQLIELLKLDSGADAAAVMAAVKKLQDDEASEPDGTAALQSALAPIGAALGVAGDADAILAGVRQLKAGAGDGAAILALQGELVTVTTRLNDALDGQARDKATAFVDAAIGAGRVGVKPMRDRYIAMHMADPAGTVELMSALPIVKAGATLSGIEPPKSGDGLNAEDERVVQLMGLDRAEYAKSLADHRQENL